MTIAHRPTFDPAKGGTGRNEGDLSKLSRQYSSWDMPSHMSVKYRQFGQAHPDEASGKNHRREIEEHERGESSSISRVASKRPKLDGTYTPATGNVDAGGVLDDLDEDASADEDSDDETDLMAELERIRKERASEKAAKNAREHAAQERIRREHPARKSSARRRSGRVPREMPLGDDVVVFKNCARELDERKKEPSFINDAIRSEFHKNFMEKYIQTGNVDADDALDDLDEDASADEASDDEAELMAELERIRKERIRQENILHGNPLLAEGPVEFRVKRRWDDDVVLKNCARGLDERKKKLINDAIRSKFHKKFI